MEAEHVAQPQERLKTFQTGVISGSGLGVGGGGVSRLCELYVCAGMPANVAFPRSSKADNGPHLPKAIPASYST